MRRERARNDFYSPTLPANFSPASHGFFFNGIQQSKSDFNNNNERLMIHSLRGLRVAFLFFFSRALVEKERLNSLEVGLE